MLTYGEIFRKVSNGFMSFATAAFAAAGAAMAGASAAVRAADALFSAFLGLVDIEGRTAYDQHDHSENDVINRAHTLTSFR